MTGAINTVAHESSEESSTVGVRGWVGERCVRIVELADEWILVQPWDDPRTWELVQADLVNVERPRSAVSAEQEVPA
ncbi:MAG TPA: hypothetical protein VK256_10675 [Candidatus Eisenbacteria bacterium]|nr:hypothetical protein [Candidatus Eisenbacteria bacterium]